MGVKWRAGLSVCTIINYYRYHLKAQHLYVYTCTVPPSPIFRWMDGWLAPPHLMASAGLSRLRLLDPAVCICIYLPAAGPLTVGGWMQSIRTTRSAWSGPCTWYVSYIDSTPPLYLSTLSLALSPPLVLSPSCIFRNLDGWMDGWMAG